MKTARYRQIEGLLANQRTKKAFLLFVSLLQVSLILYFTYEIQEVVNAVTQTSLTESYPLLVQTVLAGILTFFVSLYCTRRWHYFRYEMMIEMKEIMLKKILNKDAAFLDRKTTGDISAAVMSDGPFIAEGVGITSLMLILNVYQVVVILIVLFCKNRMLGILELTIALLYFLSINYLNQKMRSGYEQFGREQAAVTQTVVEDAKAAMEIKALGAKEYFEKRFKNQLWGGYYKAAKGIVKIDVEIYVVNQIINLFFPMAILVIGAMLAVNGTFTIGSILLFFTYTQKLVEPLNNLADCYRGNQVAMGCADRVYDYLFDEEKENAEEKTTQRERQKAEDYTLDIEIEEYSWKEGEQVLKNIHQSYRGGDRVYIKGESGSGKSTLLKLICGMYPLKHGSISIGGKPVSQMREGEIFDQIKMQFQEPVIFCGTIEENIKLGEVFREEEIREALKIACFDEFVRDVGLDYQLDENGGNISGGQKQRLALTRVLLRKPFILILDEATNGLDEATEHQVVENLKQYAKENHCILLATSHRNVVPKICNQVLDVSGRL